MLNKATKRNDWAGNGEKICTNEACSRAQCLLAWLILLVSCGEQIDGESIGDKIGITDTRSLLPPMILPHGKSSHPFQPVTHIGVTAVCSEMRSSQYEGR